MKAFQVISPESQATPGYTLFMSYRRVDGAGTVGRIHDHLTAKLKRWSIFYDHKSIEPGEDFELRLTEALKQSRVLLVFIGPNWLNEFRDRAQRGITDHVRREIELGLQHCQVLPVLIDNAQLPSEKELGDFPGMQKLLRLNCITIHPDPAFQDSINRLTAYLDVLGPEIGPGAVLGGRYKLLREIGKGGMGIVYEAQDTSIVNSDLRVAIKMILEGMDTKEVLARFEGEREALARFNHANIAGVTDSGSSPSGRPYFVMPLINGTTITEYCDRKKLGIDERISLFQQVCAGVQHAHQKGIIHRDIKPSNILVVERDNSPVPVVIDFGLAKAMVGKLGNQTLVSQLGGVVGTLLYMSPEQASATENAVDTRADVYSLGAVLYELLVGEPPFSEEILNRVGADAMRRFVIENEPSKPSTKLSSLNELPRVATNRALDSKRLTAIVRGDLDWIVMKSLEKDVDRRYGTAVAFADDLTRYLKNEPVFAGKQNWSYVLLKFYRRNRAKVVASTLIFLALVFGLVTSLWQMNRALAAERKALENEVLANTNASRANEEAEKRRKTADELAASNKKLTIALESATAINKALDDVFSKIENDLKDNPKFEQVALELYAVINDSFERELVANPENLSLKRDLSEKFIVLAWNLNNMEKHELALQAYGRSLELLESLCEQQNAPLEVKLRKTFVVNNIGWVYAANGQDEKALAYYESSLKMRRELVDQNPNELECQRQFAVSLANIGAIIIEKDVDTAINYLLEASGIERNLTFKQPDVLWRFLNLSSTLNNLSKAYTTKGNSKLAIAAKQESYEIRKSLLERRQARPADSNEIAISVFMEKKGLVGVELAAMLQKAGTESGQVLTILEESLQLLKQLTTESPQNASYKSLFEQGTKIAKEILANDHGMVVPDRLKALFN